MELKENVFLESVQTHEKILKKFKTGAFPVIKSIVESVLTCYQKSGKILLVGNGGSAADCQHIAGELVGRFKLERKPLPAISLATDSSLMTCIANDYDYEVVFSRQIEAIGNKPDIVWALSTSGNSPNIIKGVKLARKKEIKVISFTGKPKSQLEQLSDICLCADTENTGHAQEIHQIAYHIICKYIDQVYSGSAGIK